MSVTTSKSGMDVIYFETFLDYVLLFKYSHKTSEKIPATQY